MLCAWHRHIYHGKVKFSGLLFWQLLWNMAHTLEERWLKKLSRGEEPHFRQDRASLTAQDWLKKIDENTLEFMVRTNAALLPEEEKSWLLERFKNTHPSLRVHTIATYLKMAAEGEAGVWRAVDVVEARPRVLAFTNASVFWVEQQLSRLEPMGGRLVHRAPWKVPKPKLLT